MDLNNKDWLKFALDLYGKTKEMGLINNLGMDGLDSLIETAGRFNSTGPGPTQPGKGEKIQQESKLTDQEKAENEIFWQQESGSPHDKTFGVGATNSGYDPPISVYESAKEVSVHVILPGIASRDNLVLLLSHEALELSGTRIVGGFSGGDKRNEKFYRIVRLPVPVEPSGANATYRNGFLYLNAPKKNRLFPLRIEVKFE